MLNASSAQLLRDLKDDDDLCRQADESEEVVVKMMERYDLVALRNQPAGPNHHRRGGRVIEDAERDYQLASGISEDVEARTRGP